MYMWLYSRPVTAVMTYTLPAKENKMCAKLQVDSFETERLKMLILTQEVILVKNIYTLVWHGMLYIQELKKNLQNWVEERYLDFHVFKELSPKDVYEKIQYYCIMGWSNSKSMKWIFIEPVDDFTSKIFGNAVYFRRKLFGWCYSLWRN